MDYGGVSSTEANGGSDRKTWGSKVEFLLAGVGYAVGLGNIWRFPYLVFTNGGGAFLVPYFVIFFFIGIPLFVLELSLGQYMRRGTTGSLAAIHPRLEGIGWVGVAVTFLVGIYYNVIIAWALFYFGVSFTSELPWGDDAEGYFLNTVLEVTSTVNDVGGIKLDLLVCLTVVWVLTFLAVFKGTDSLGKVVYFTSTFPYVVITIFVVRGLTLPGASKGLAFYFIPDWERVLEMDTWLAAGSQIFYSLGVGWGTIVAYASYQPVDSNFVRDAWFIGSMNAFSSLFAGVAVFSILGHMASEEGREISDIIQSGAGLTFIAYPAAMAELPAGPFFSVMFFLMLLCVGFGSVIGMVENVQTAIMDLGYLPESKRWYVTGSLCLVAWLLSLLYVSRSGLYWVDISNDFLARIALFMVCLLEVFAVVFAYGPHRYVRDVCRATGQRISAFYRLSWMFLIPLPLIVLISIGVSTIMAGEVAAGHGCGSDRIGDDDDSEEEEVSCENLGWFAVLAGVCAFVSLLPLCVLTAKNWRKKDTTGSRAGLLEGSEISLHSCSAPPPIGKDGSSRQISFRVAAPGDIEQLAALEVDAFVSKYIHALGADHRGISPAVARGTWDANPWILGNTLVAVVMDEVVAACVMRFPGDASLVDAPLPAMRRRQACGLCCLRAVTAPETLPSGTAVVEKIFTQEEIRGQGVGTRLLDYADACAQQRNCSRIFLWVVEGNPAQSLYERHGYEVTDDTGRWWYDCLLSMCFLRCALGVNAARRMEKICDDD